MILVPIVAPSVLPDSTADPPLPGSGSLRCASTCPLPGRPADRAPMPRPPSPSAPAPADGWSVQPLRLGSVTGNRS
ncbi:hypothetical protein G6F52_014208 [Rhizopus delemar]|nr:hypothetical protein G6F52_014208 [Rhizopus delemar]